MNPIAILLFSVAFYFIHSFSLSLWFCMCFFCECAPCLRAYDALFRRNLTNWATWMWSYARIVFLDDRNENENRMLTMHHDNHKNGKENNRKWYLRILTLNWMEWRFQIYTYIHTICSAHISCVGSSFSFRCLILSISRPACLTLGASHSFGPYSQQQQRKQNIRILLCTFIAVVWWVESLVR